jgi:hypothetical protein
MPIIGDMKIHGELECKTTYEYLENECNGIEQGQIKYHVWVITQNFLLIDPTIRLKESEREDFLAKKTNSGLFICDLENIPENLEYIPMLVGTDFILKSNPIEIIHSQSL